MEFYTYLFTITGIYYTKWTKKKKYSIHIYNVSSCVYNDFVSKASQKLICNNFLLTNISSIFWQFFPENKLLQFFSWHLLEIKTHSYPIGFLFFSLFLLKNIFSIFWYFSGTFLKDTSAKISIAKIFAASTARIDTSTQNVLLSYCHVSETIPSIGFWQFLQWNIYFACTNMYYFFTQLADIYWLISIIPSPHRAPSFRPFEGPSKILDSTLSELLTNT